MTLTIGWIGLGTMGGPMAGHLLRAGHTVQAFNRNPARAEQWQGLDRRHLLAWCNMR